MTPPSHYRQMKISGDAQSHFTIPVGNYTSGESLADAVNATPQMISTGLSATFDAQANKFSFFHSQAGNISIATYELTNSHRLLGLSDTFNVTVAPNTITYTQRQADLSGVRMILVASETFELDVTDSQKNSGEYTTNLLAGLPISVAFGGIQTFKSDNAPYMAARRRSLSSVIITLLDENQKPYDISEISRNISDTSTNKKSMNWGRFGRQAARWGSNALPKLQRFGMQSGRFLHNAAEVASRVANTARTGINAIQNNSELSRIPGLNEALGIGRDIVGGLSTAAQVAGRLGNFASQVGESKELRGLTNRFERAANY
ncbi:hypothetical protein T492DRAFT_831923 [Pavlovales sp. CCMP2436]|nr:hypothetical protein T492DRAFT_831923 [Pavlovales sp. CCMP2436]